MRRETQVKPLAAAAGPVSEQTNAQRNCLQGQEMATSRVNIGLRRITREVAKRYLGSQVDATLCLLMNRFVSKKSDSASSEVNNTEGLLRSGRPEKLVDEPRSSISVFCTHSPVIDALDTVSPTAIPRSADVPALSSRTYFAGAPEGIVCSEKGVVSAAILTILPAASM